jgi:hypothetical protein
MIECLYPEDDDICSQHYSYLQRSPRPNDRSSTRYTKCPHQGDGHGLAEQALVRIRWQTR